MKKAIITGVTGQDGSYLAESLFEKGYQVYGIVRRVSTPNYKNIYPLLVERKIHLLDGVSMVWDAVNQRWFGTSSASPT